MPTRKKAKAQKKTAKVKAIKKVVKKTKVKKAPVLLIKKSIRPKAKKAISKTSHKVTKKRIAPAPKQLVNFEVAIERPSKNIAKEFSEAVSMLDASTKEFQTMKTNGRGTEITKPEIKIEQQAEVVAAQEESRAELGAVLYQDYLTAEDEAEMREQDEIALQLVREKLAAATRHFEAKQPVMETSFDAQDEHDADAVMIRSVSPLQTNYAHSSREFVEEKKTSRAPALLFATSAFVFAVFLASAIAMNLGGIQTNLGSIATGEPKSAPRVAGASTGIQEYTNGNFSFSYPGDWFLSESQGTIRLAESQSPEAAAVVLTPNALSGKSFNEWFASQAVYKDMTVSRVDDTSAYTFELVDARGGASGTYFFVVSSDTVVSAEAQGDDSGTREILTNVIDSFSFQ